MSERFTLEELSKISGARSSERVLAFFQTLDRFVSDEEISGLLSTNTFAGQQSVTRFREDIEMTQSNVTEAIIANFPEKEGSLLVVPQIL